MFMCVCVVVCVYMYVYMFVYACVSFYVYVNVVLNLNNVCFYGRIYNERKKLEIPLGGRKKTQGSSFGKKKLKVPPLEKKNSRFRPEYLPSKCRSVCTLTPKLFLGCGWRSRTPSKKIGENLTSHYHFLVCGRGTFSKKV